ncbi:hypothetical protein JOD55_000310 [Arcanobacterium pluranimalium]|nr:hypothetical protein [Arcanobacterium pluranimalium]
MKHGRAQGVKHRPELSVLGVLTSKYDENWGAFGNISTYIEMLPKAPQNSVGSNKSNKAPHS